MQTDAATAGDTRLHGGVGGVVGQRAAATFSSTLAVEDPSRLPMNRESEERTASIAAQQNVNVRPSQIGTAGQLLAGGVAGAVSKTCTAPLARLTILFQVQGMNANGEKLSRPSILKEAARIVREEGFRAFWKGNGVTIVHRLPYSSVNFFAYEQYKMHLRSMLGIEGKQESLGVGMGTRLVAGGAAGITAATLTYPLDLVRTRLAAQTKHMYYTGISHALKTIYTEEGPRGLYKGLGTTLLGVGPNIAINFCVYETLKSLWLQSRPESSPVVVSLGCGSLAGICSSTATFPIDLVRRRMQLEGAGGKARVYKEGLVGTVGHIVSVEGWFGLYRGIVPEYFKVIPSVGIVFMTYEFIKRILQPDAWD
ncbi:hypothetical protein R1flu_021048 [Riccia fluitans]|uniref:Mitochondrial carrier protein n=1 Tax=Riccia fluitans TaxID=41844 RepID=A0ABD1ZN82_9MARC